MGDSVVFWIIAEKRFRCANNRNRNAQPRENGMDPRKDLGIRDVLAVPRQEILYAMVGHRRDVQCIDLSLRRQNSGRHDLTGDPRNLGIVRQKRNAIQCAQAVARERRISRGCLVNHVLGDNQLVVLSIMIPPAVSEQLSRSSDELGAGSLPQVADDRRLDVDGVHHVSLPRRTLPISRRRRVVFDFKTLDFAARLHRMVRRKCDDREIIEPVVSTPRAGKVSTELKVWQLATCTR